MRLSRADHSLLSDWWFTVDRVLLAAILTLVGAGLVLSLAASPAIAVKRGLGPYYYVERHALFAVLAVAVMLMLSLLDPRRLRRAALAILAVSLVLMALVLVIGPEINGAHRWIRVLGYSLQPSELAKPAFVFLTAWLLAEGQRRPDVPATAISVGLYLAFAALLVVEPDFGQTLLVTGVWGLLFFISGLPLRWAGVLGALALLGSGFAYYTFPHVKGRIDRFFDPSVGDTFQTDRAWSSFLEGGFVGRGPGEGTIKTTLPDAHTDFILAVIAEEYGVLACLALLALLGFIVFRPLLTAIGTADAFTRFSVIGLCLLFGGEALINMAVNVGLIPAKGMTLPFVSAGGSATLGMGIAMGLLLGALRRRRPGTAPPGAEPLPRGVAGFPRVK